MTDNFRELLLMHNPHADDIDYQIEADFAGLMSPGMPNTASEISDKSVTSLRMATAGMVVCMWALYIPWLLFQMIWSMW